MDQTTTATVPAYVCLRCGHTWSRARNSRGAVRDELPARCPACSSDYWDTPPTIGRARVWHGKRGANR